MLLVTHSVCVPLLSESEYLSTSKTRLIVDPSGFLTSNERRTAVRNKGPVDVKSVPGSRRSWRRGVAIQRLPVHRPLISSSHEKDFKLKKNKPLAMLAPAGA
ncbi:hypothetical protein PG988_000341 [Apiospora saccharicola]